jgi:hypothetical protein
MGVALGRAARIGAPHFNVRSAVMTGCEDWREVRSLRLAAADDLLEEMRRTHGDECVDTVLACAAVRLTGLMATNAYLKENDYERDFE